MRPDQLCPSLPLACQVLGVPEGQHRCGTRAPWVTASGSSGMESSRSVGCAGNRPLCSLTSALPSVLGVVSGTQNPQLSPLSDQIRVSPGRFVEGPAP